ncbi:MAG: anhydro-N-acetylmuramic acid kinase [Paracoccaceae bacterium]|nr:anhydro-N-acetylmuramic acid kinase [Paracoccaceae bacterium]
MLKGGAVWALGAMSGTSLDGVDAAMVLTDGVRILEFGETAYRPYTDAERAVLRAALGQWPDGAAVESAAEVVETAHAEVLSRFSGVDLVGFHGQTLAHDPRGRGTHQAGSGAVLAEVLGLPVVWDFRTADVKMGGQGAPLAPFYHFACAKWIEAKVPLAFLNMGGVGNLTWVDPRQPAAEGAGACLAFDTGPANAPVNDLMQARRGLALDASGALAGTGQVDAAILARFLNHSYFYKMPPKSLDRNDFADLSEAVRGLSDADACATMTAAAAAAVGRGVDHFPTPVARILVTGGGRHNATLMAMLADFLPCEVAPIEVAGLDGDMLEAQAFAYLAVRVASGFPTSGPSTTGVAGAVGGGQISRPGVGSNLLRVGTV